MLKQLTIISVLLLTFCCIQASSPADTTRNGDLRRLLFGIRFSAELDLLHTQLNTGQRFRIQKNGYRIGGGAYLAYLVAPRVYFEPFFGLFYQVFAKGPDYQGACDQNDFPTFWNVHDTLPGRDLHFVKIAIEPAFKILIGGKGTLHVRIAPFADFNLLTRVENYGHSCGNTLPRGFLNWENTTDRRKSVLQLGLGAGLVKEVHLGPDFGLSLEPGIRFSINPLLNTSDENNPDAPGFKLNFWGFYLNLSLFR